MLKENNTFLFIAYVCYLSFLMSKMNAGLKVEVDAKYMEPDW